MNAPSSGMLFEDESYAIRGAVFEVYSQLGAGFAEPVYQEALEMEFALLPFEAQKPIRIAYKGRELSQTYRADILCFGKIILELKSVRVLLPEHEAQLVNYLKAGAFRLGFLINFSHVPLVDIRRYVN